MDTSTSLKASPCPSLKQDRIVPLPGTARAPRWSRTLPTPPAVDTMGVRTWATQAPEGPWPPPDADFPHRPSSHLPPPQSALIRKVINSSFSLCVPFNREPLCLRQSQKQPVGSGASAVTQIGCLGRRPCRTQASMLFPSSSHHPSPVSSLEIVFIG